MNFSLFLEMLPEDLQKKYVDEIIEREGTVSEVTWKEIADFLQNSYKEIPDYKLELKNAVRESACRKIVRESMQKKGINIEEYLQDLIIEFEDILELNPVLVKKALGEIEKDELVKALYIVSPDSVAYFQKLYPNIDFKEERKVCGSILIEDAIKANGKIIELINESLL